MQGSGPGKHWCESVFSSMYQPCELVCLHCTSRRRDLKEKERNGFCGISQFTVYYYSHFLFISFLNTVPPPALNHLHNLQPLSSAVHKSDKRVVDREPPHPHHISLVPRLPRWRGITHAKLSLPQTSSKISPRREAALAHPPTPLQCPPVSPVTWMPFQLVALQPEHCCHY